MALVCASDISSVDLGFVEFIDCKTLSISYDILGVSTLGFTVVAAQAQPVDPSIYTNLTFGGINFTGVVTSLAIRRVAGTIVYEHQYSITGVGCRV